MTNDGRGWPFAASIFDMDGLLVDSEPLWHEAEVEVLGGLGVPIATGDPRRTKGIFVREVARYWYERFGWEGPSTDEVATRIVDRVIDLVAERGRLQPGVDTAISLCRAHGLALAVASSSEHRLITFVLERFGLARHFSFAHSAEEEPYGKPHPAVFLTTAQRLGVAPDRCLVWEDAPAGVLAAKAARMTCVAVPAPDERDHPVFSIADAVLSSLEEADETLWARLVSARLAVDGTSGRAPVGPG
ncbi:MAG TPA: hexitol phosphatase HxpB [Acidimicrobiales bacterium]|nr:hexitol phosphatase HxpB [Acidimicrobiales bacterium]